MPDKNKTLDESAQRAIAKVRGEMPDVSNVSVNPSSSNMLARFFMPKQSIATTNPFTGNVTYNPDQLTGMSQGEIENTIAHELTHSRQAAAEPFYKVLMNALNPMRPDYYDRPEELVAFQAEKDRTLAKHLSVPDPITGNRDIPLPRDKANARVR